jgi:hypothetical protein
LSAGRELSQDRKSRSGVKRSVPPKWDGCPWPRNNKQSNFTHPSPIGVIGGVGSALNQMPPMPPMPSTADYERDSHVASSVEKLFLYAYAKGTPRKRACGAAEDPLIAFARGNHLAFVEPTMFDRDF